MYQSPIELDMGMVDKMHRLVMETTEDGILKAVWQMGIKVDKQGLIDAMTQDKKRYEYAYDKGWHDCEEHYKKQLAQIAEIATRKDGNGDG